MGIHAGTRLTHQKLELNDDIDSLCTGIVKDKNARLITSQGDASRLAYIATYGRQSLNSDELGLAVFFNPADAVDFSEDANSHIVTLKTSQGKLEYYFLASWAGEPDGIKDEQSFVAYLEKISQQLQGPVLINISQ